MQVSWQQVQTAASVVTAPGLCQTRHPTLCPGGDPTISGVRGPNRSLPRSFLRC